MVDAPVEIPVDSLIDILPNPPSSSSQAYLNYLTTLPLPNLLSEPSALQTQAHHLTSSLTSLTHTSYSTFLALHGTTTALAGSLDSLSTSLASLLTKSLPALEDSAAAWRTRTETVLHQRNKARVVLDQHDKLKDLLDIPLFIDTCVRNGYFSEALSLANHATSLSLGPNAPPIFASVQAEVHHSITQMLSSLLTTLHEPNRKLPTLWKAVNFLRKMNAFEDTDNVSSEEQLALAFLSGRLTCLIGILDPISRDIHRLTTPSGDETAHRKMSDREKEDVARYLKKYIDAWREGVYDIITQYSTIFLEPQSSKQHASSPSPPPAPPTTLLPLLTTSLLTSHLFPLLQSTLPLLPLPLLPSLVTQLTYCATAFARVGLDFRGVLSGMVENSVLASVSADLRDAGASWAKAIATHRKRRPSEWLLVPALADSPPTATAARGPAHIPPQVLTSYPPLAEHTNALLGVLNSLRLLAPVGIMRDLAGVLEDVLAEGGEFVLEYLKGWVGQSGANGGGDDEERERESRIAKAGGDIYFRVFVPFVRRGLVEGVYGAKENDVEDGEQLGKVIMEWNVTSS
jgi:hypothetical protein